MILRSPAEDENGGICDRLSPLSNLSPSRGKALIPPPLDGEDTGGVKHRKPNFLRSSLLSRHRRPRDES
jgi:hypothetical protein